MPTDFRRIGDVCKHSMNQQMKALNGFQGQGQKVMAMIAERDF